MEKKDNENLHSPSIKFLLEKILNATKNTRNILDTTNDVKLIRLPYYRKFSSFELVSQPCV